jgi:alpha-tubulin suppressor-like RCC1 family protein
MTRKGVWNLQQVRDKYLQSLWANPIGLWSMGYNNQGQLAQNNRTQYSSPVQIGSNDEGWQASGPDAAQTYSSINDIAMFAIKNDSTLWAWGSNEYGGSLGQNQPTNSNRSSPVQIPGTNWKSVGGGNNYINAVKTDGTLWHWGNNQEGESAQNEPEDKAHSSPIQIGSDTTWSSSSSAGSHYGVLARKTDGTLWSWGSNEYGGLGLNNMISYSSPVQIGSDTTWSDKYTLGLAGIAIKTDGTLWTWGWNMEGQNGQNQPGNTRYSSPVQIGSGTDWALVYKGGGTQSRNPLAVKTDGSLWTWGDNSRGSLGQNNTTQYSSPVQVPGSWSTTIRPTATNYGRTVMAIKSDSTLWAWGLDYAGQLGQNTQGIHYSSPTQIPGAWGDISIGNHQTLALRLGLAPSQL